MIIIRRLLVLLLIAICCGIIANADGNKSYKCEGNTYSSTGRVNDNSSAIDTGFNCNTHVYKYNQRVNN